MESGTRAVLRKRPECALFLGSRVDWVWTAQSLGFDPVFVHFRQNNPLISLVQRLLPRATIVVGAYGSLHTRVFPRVAFIHGHAGNFNFLFEKVDVILSTKGRRGRVPAGWQLSKARTTHAAVGGVTDSIDHCFLWHRGTGESCQAEVPVPRFLPRDVNSVVSDTVNGRACHKPDHARLVTPIVQELRPGLYHAGGLLPVDQPKSHFVVRCVYTASKWCRRRLTQSKLATAFDVPHEVIQQAQTQDLPFLVCHPSRGLEHCAKSLLAHAKIIDRGGRYVFSAEGTPALVSKVDKPTEEAENGKKGKEKETAEGSAMVRKSAPCEAPCSDHAGGIDWIAIGEQDGVELDENGAYVEPKATAREAARRKGATEEEQADFAKDPGTSEAQQSGQKRNERDLKAVKSDDAEVPIWLWNDAIRQGLMVDPISRGHSVEAIDHALDVFRGFLLQRKFKLGVTRSYFDYLKGEHDNLTKPDRMAIKTRVEQVLDNTGEVIATIINYSWRPKFGKAIYRNWWNDFWKQAGPDRAPGYDAIWRVAESSWWDWDAGSAPFYWRWPAEYRGVIRDGLEIWFKGEKPRWRRAQKKEPKEATRQKVIEKISKVRKRKYIAPGYVWSLTDFFSVPKGDQDIRMVYNGTSSGLNDSLWVPSFPLPTVDSLLRSVQPNTWMADTDLGEMFLNFVLHDSLRELAGVDVTNYRKGSESQEGVCWERWNRCAMGLKPSPYQTTQAMLFAEDVIRGDPASDKNVFQWDSVRMNLPGSEAYDPSLPWVYKVKKDGSPAADFFFYVDDNRTTGNTEQEAWLAARRVASVCSHLGIQDAARKRRKASQTPGAWAGAVVSTDDDGVYVSVSQEKWDKARVMVSDTMYEIEVHKGWIERKGLERKRGFLLYVTRTFPSMVPYLKGFHLTLDGWRGGRDNDGWKYLGKETRELQEQGEPTGVEPPTEAPKRVQAKARLVECDLPALTELLEEETPPKRVIRSKKVAEVYYGFGDASQDGFGFNIQKPDDDTLLYRFGQWCDSVSEESSNYRELLNLVIRLEELVKDGTLKGAEVFIFTDNSTAESVFYKGNSSSRMLFELMLRLRKLEMKGDLKLHMIHVSGTRMQEEGADGASRGDHSTGVMKGNHILDYIPLHESAIEIEPGVKLWLERLWPSERGELEFLTPNDWLNHGRGGGRNCVWAPAPAAADVAAEQLARAVHQHPDSCHIFIAPRLMTSRWRRRVGRLADFEFELGAGSSSWPKERHEPLLIFVILPLSKHRPWKLQGTGLLVDYGRKLRLVHKEDCKRRGRILCQLLRATSRLECMSQSVVRRMLLRPEHKSVSDTTSRG